MMKNSVDTEYIILENIYTSGSRNLSLKQRDLAKIARSSLGMTNSILKRLIQKGWITARRLNSRNIHYAVTGEGFNEIIHRSYRYFKRTIKNVVVYKDAINDFIQNAVNEQMNAVILIGSSDLEFIIEHSCQYYGLSFFKSTDENLVLDEKDNKTLLIFAEDIPVPVKFSGNNVHLSQLLIKSAVVS
ncbi:MAG: MarR family transcriptional regulator [Treponema sp.]|nr:MarR family transcriptional regulator [Treponema sp.]